MSNWTKTGERLDRQAAARNRAAIREKFGVSNTVPVYPGDVDSPKLIGNSGGHYTRGGVKIRHPGAYTRAGWSNVIYRKSTFQIVVPFAEFRKYQ